MATIADFLAGSGTASANGLQSAQTTGGGLQSVSGSISKNGTMVSQKDILIRQLMAAAPGAEWDASGVNRAAELADLLMKQGVTDISGGIGLKTSDYTVAGRPAGNYESGDSTYWAEAEPDTIEQRKQITIGDKTLGFLGDYNNDGTYGNKADEYLQGDLAAWSARGHGNVGYSVQQDPATGKYAIVPNWGSSSDAGTVQDVLKGAALVAAAYFAAPYLGAAEGAAAAGGAASSAPLNMAMIESGLGTAGYGFNAGAAASGLFNPATIGAGAYAGSVADAIASGAAAPQLTPAALESMIGTPGYGINAAADAALEQAGAATLSGANAIAPAELLNTGAWNASGTVGGAIAEPTQIITTTGVAEGGINTLPGTLPSVPPVVAPLPTGTIPQATMPQIPTVPTVPITGTPSMPSLTDLLQQGVNLYGQYQNAQNTSDAANNSVSAIMSGLDSGINEIKTRSDAAQANFNPYMAAGNEAIGRTVANANQLTPGIQQGMGVLNAQTAPLNVNQFLDPSMDFTMQQGQNAIQNSAASRGSALSGAAVKDALEYSQKLASTNWNNAAGLALQNRGQQITTGSQLVNAGVQGAQLNNNVMNTGYNAAGANANLAAQTGENLAAMYANQGNAAATGILGQNAANQQQTNANTNIGNALGNAVGSYFGGSSGGSVGGALGSLAGMLFSDEDMKYDIEAESPEELAAMLKALKPKSFNYTQNAKNKGAPNGRQTGVIAQDLEKSKAGKRLVEKNASGERMINIPMTVSTLLATAASQQKEIENLKRKK